MNSQMPVTEERIQEIVRISEDILSDYVIDGGKLESPAVHSVIQKFTEAIRALQRTDLSDDDINLIMGSLVTGRNTRSYDTNVRQRAFVYLAGQLKRKKIINYKKISVIKPIRRFQLLDLEENALRNLPHIQRISDYLLSYKHFDADKVVTTSVPVDKKAALIERKRAVEYLCSFIAAAAIFGKIGFDGFHRWLMEMTHEDMFLLPCFIIERHPDSNALSHFFLPTPAALYFLRAASYYRKHTGQCDTEQDPRKRPLFDPALKDSIAEDFRKWTKKILGKECEQGLTVDEFRRAVKLATNLNVPNGPNVPPFILTGQYEAEGIKPHAYSGKHLPYFTGVNNGGRIDYDDRLAAGEKKLGASRPAFDNIVQRVVAGISRIRRALNKDGMHYKKMRKETLDSMYQALDAGPLPKDSAEYRNMQMYLKWIDDMVMNADIEMSSINTYASLVPRFFYALIGSGPVDSLPLQELIDYLIWAITSAGSPGMRKALKRFCVFLGKKVGSPFSDINWNLKLLRKENIPNLKSFASFKDVDDSLIKAEEFYTRYARSIKEEGTRNRLVQAALHKVNVIKQVIVLAYYCGMRCSEILSLRCYNVMAGGQYLTIRKKIKTINGKRNINLTVFLPKDKLDAFMSYVAQRRKEAGSSGLLFLQENGKEWKAPHVSGEVARLFLEMGFKIFRMHHLRHALANILIFRWLDCEYPDIVKGIRHAPIFEHDFFQNEEKRSQFRALLYGLKPAGHSKTKYPYFLYFVRCVLGHGGPGVFLRDYFHVGDIMFYLWTRESWNEKMTLTVRRVEDFMQVSHGRAATIINEIGGNMIDASAFYQYQLKEYENN